MNTIPLQSLDIYEFFCDNDLIDKVMDDVNGPNVSWDYIEDDGTSSHTGYLNNQTFYYHPELFAWFQECVDKVAEKHFNNLKLSIVDSWLTKTDFGNQSHQHNHTYSVISGLLYFSTFKKSRTVFKYKDPWLDNYPMMYFPEKQLTVTPEKGKLIIWRSDIDHMIERHTDIKKTRHTLAFNAFFDGVLCDIRTRKLELKVNSVKNQYEEYMKNKDKQ